jgi:phage gp16-like protein
MAAKSAHKAPKADLSEAEQLRHSRMSAIAIMQKQLGIETDNLRCLMLNTVGKSSRTEMDLHELTKVRDALVAKGGKLTAPGGKALAKNADGQERKLRALWLRGAELGILRESSDAALCSWAANSRSPNVTVLLSSLTSRQMHDAIERLKAWLSREIKQGELVCDDGHVYRVLDHHVAPVIERAKMQCPHMAHDECPSLIALMRWRKAAG